MVATQVRKDQQTIQAASLIKMVSEDDMPDRLGDPCNDRRMPEVEPPYVGYLEDDKLWISEGLPDWEMIVHLYKGEGQLSKS